MRPEDTLQILTCNYLDKALPRDICWTALEHAGQLTPYQGAVRKKKGVRSGLPDLQFLYRGRSMAIELKTATGRQSENQKQYAAEFVASGGFYQVARSIAEVAEFLGRNGVPLRFQPPPPAPDHAKSKPKRLVGYRPESPSPALIRRVGKMRSRIMF